MSILLSNLVVRPPTLEDCSAIAELVEACDSAEHGIAESSMRDLASRWRKYSFHLESDAWVIVTGRKQLIGFACVWHRDYEEFSTFICVHPQERRRGIDTLLLRLAEQHAHELIHDARPDARVSLRGEASATNAQARSLFEREGYRLIREFWRVALALVDSDGDGASPPRKFAVDVEVEAGRLSGAAQLFDREGLFSVRQFVTYEKELRPAAEECDCPSDSAETLSRV